MKKIIILIILLAPLVSHSQFAIKPLNPGETYTNKTADTLVITSFDRIKKAVVVKREYKIALQEIEKSNEIIQKLTEQNEARDEKSDAQADIVKSYENQVTGCELHVKNLKKEAKKQKRQKIMAMGGGAILVILSILFL